MKTNLENWDVEDLVFWEQKGKKGALNNALERNLYFTLTTFVGSLLMAIASIWVLRYLPEPLKKKPKKKPSVNVSRQP